MSEASPIDATNHEQQLVGSLMLDLSRAADVAFVSASMFGDDRYAAIWPHLLLLATSHRAFDPDLFVSRLLSEGDLERAGGIAFIAKVAESVAVASHAAYHAAEVCKAAKRRAIIAAAQLAIEAANDPAADVDAIVGTAEASLRKADSLGAQAATTTAGDAAQAAIEAAKLARANVNQAGVRFGISDIDNRFGGLAAGELVVLAARPGEGKTSLAMQLATHACRKGQTCLVVTLEMDASELALRALAGDCGIDSRVIRAGSTSDDDIERLANAADAWSQLPLAILDAPRCTMADIRRAAKGVKRSSGDLSLVVVDYIGLVAPANARLPRHEQVAEITRELKQLARELQVPVLALAQLNRQSESSRDGKPKLSHLRESGAIEQDADKVLFLHRTDATREDPDSEGVVSLIIAKNRNGPIGEAELFFDAARTRFSALERRYTEFDAWSGK